MHARFGRVLDALADKLPQVAAHLDAARADILAFTSFPKANWPQISGPTTPGTAEPRDPPPHRRRGESSGRDALIRLAGAVLAEQHDEQTEMRRYISLDVLAKSRLTIAGQNTQPEELTLTTITAESPS